MHGHASVPQLGLFPINTNTLPPGLMSKMGDELPVNPSEDEETNDSTVYGYMGYKYIIYHLRTI